MNKLNDEIVLVGARIMVRRLIELHGYEFLFSDGNLALINIWVRDAGEDGLEIEVEKIKANISHRGKINLPNG